MTIAGFGSQQAFIEEVLFSNALSAAFQRSTTYREGSDFSSYQKDALRRTLKSFLRSVVDSPVYANGSISDAQHNGKICELADKVSIEHSDLLDNGRLRIGTAQKTLNLYLKFHWCLGKVAEPPHCPIDSVVIEKLPAIVVKRLPKRSHGYRWTKLDSIEDYQRLIDELRSFANGKSLAKWELEAYETQYG